MRPRLESDASDEDDAGSSESSTGGEPTPEPSSDPLDGLPTGDAQWELLCARGHGDAIAAAFCAGDALPQVTSITELLELLGLHFQPGNMSNAENGNPGFTFAYHSTAISGRFVNPLNPRAFVFTPPVGGVVFPPSGVPDPNLVMTGFARGEPFVELVASDPIADVLRFYLFRFDLACEADPAGCPNAFLTEPIRAERGAAGCDSALQPTSSCSPTWDAIYAEAVAGDAIAVPYFDGHITDPDALSAASSSYRATMLGGSPPEDMDDIRDILLDDAAPYMSYAPAPGLDGRGILDHMCKHCSCPSTTSSGCHRSASIRSRRRRSSG